MPRATKSPTKSPTKPKRTKVSPVRRKASSDDITVRMYRHGLGDCFLLRFPKSTGEGTFNLLIDCGLISVASNPKDTMLEVVQDLAECTGGHLDVVVMTHEHWDHVSGFSEQQCQSAFNNFHDIKEVWYAWTEDPSNKLARKLRAERSSGLRALAAAQMTLSALSLGVDHAVESERARRVGTLLQFFGIEAGELNGPLSAAESSLGKSRKAFEYLANREGVKVRYYDPGSKPITLPGVDGVRVYVLGPPQAEAMIKRSSPTAKGKEVYELASEAETGESLRFAFERAAAGTSTAGDSDLPFESAFCIQPGDPVPEPLRKLMDQTWGAPGQEWRRIENDWTRAVETLALNLDSHTNNTCLVLAFELIESGRVLLFPGDAQVGNWLSWQDTHWKVRSAAGTEETVTGPDLLSRTAFYKVGHHGSHNATLRTQGLEQMTSNELVAFVPVFKEQAEKNRWHEMPFGPLVKRLQEKTGGRLVFSDRKVKAPKPADLDALDQEDQRAFLQRLKVEDLYYEYSIPL